MRPAITPAPLIVHKSKCQKYASAGNQLYPVSALQDITSCHFNSYQSTAVRNAIPQRLQKARRPSTLIGMLSIFCPLSPWIKSNHQKCSYLKPGEFPSLGRFWHYALHRHKRFSKKEPPVIYWLRITRCSLYEDPSEKFLLGHNCVASALQNTKKVVTNCVFLQLLRSSESNLYTTSSYSCVLTLCLVWFYSPPLFPIALISSMTQEWGWEGEKLEVRERETGSFG